MAARAPGPRPSPSQVQQADGALQNLHNFTCVGVAPVLTNVWGKYVVDDQPTSKEVDLASIAFYGEPEIRESRFAFCVVAAPSLLLSICVLGLTILFNSLNLHSLRANTSRIQFRL